MTFFEPHHQRKSDGSEYRTRKWGTGFTWVLLLILLIFASWLGLDISTPLSLLRIFVGPPPVSDHLCLPEFSFRPI